MSEKWRCDSCGQDIDSVESGNIEWLRKEVRSGIHECYGMRIVHNDSKCMYDGMREKNVNNVSVPWRPLTTAYSQDGMIDLLELISDNEFKNNDDVLEVIKRLFIPNYEVARFHFEEAISFDCFEPNTKPGFYRTSDIQRTMEYIRDEGIK